MSHGLQVFLLRYDNKSHNNVAGDARWNLRMARDPNAAENIERLD